MNFHVYRSSAGSGKTHTLVSEYLGIVLKDPSSFRHVLAVTFTNKAANEMRVRILRSLTEIADHRKYAASNAVKYMMPDLMKKSGLFETAISNNAALVLSRILHNYQDFSVSTIDSFIHRIIRTFAFDLHLPLNFEVEVEANTIVTQAVDLLLSRVGVEDGPTKALSLFTESRIYEEKNWNIERDLKKFSERLLKDDVVRFLPALQKMDTDEILKVSRLLKGFCREFEDGLSQRAGKIINFWEQHGIQASDLYYANSGIYGFINRFYNRDLSRTDPNTYVEATLGEDKWYKDALPDDRKAVVNAVKNEMIGMVSHLLTYIEEHIEKYNLYKVLSRNIFPLAVLNEILKVLDQIRENDGVIHISEFDKRISAVVNHEPVPFIYERLGEKYRHFLIDEFQDTSVLEWQNILPLIDNALAEGHFNMIVGDEKQAIYRFKGGEVEQLVRLPEIFDKLDSPEMLAREESLKRNYNQHVLNYNYRSRDEIIKFNNDFYAFCGGLLPSSLQKIYADSAQEMPGEKPGGEISITFIDIEGNKSEKEPLYYEYIIQKVTELKDDKGYAYQDIAILCRSNHEASRIARQLLLNGIDVISAESLLLSSSPEVNFLVSCLDYIANPKDKPALAGMLTYLAIRSDINRVHGLLHTNMAAARPSAHIDDLNSYLQENNIIFKTAELRQMGLYERVETLIRIFSLHNTLDPYLVFFLDTVHDYSMNKRFVPEDFTIFWRDNRHRFSIVVPEGMDAVKVMTIHKAKGLEFPVVIYPFANDTVKLMNEQEWVALADERLPALKTALLPVNKSLEKTPFSGVYEHEWQMQQLDLLNILYVATTRPTERLFIVCDKPTKTPEGIKDVPGLIRAYLEHKAIWQEEQSIYSFGNTHELPQVEKQRATSVHPGVFISGNWRENILLSGHAAEYWDLEDDSRNIEWGNLVHQVLSRVNTSSDLEPAILAEVNKGIISGEKGHELLKSLKEILDKEDVRPFFDGSYALKNEAGILTKTGEYRPDRLMIKPDHAIVMDYKTGKEDDKHIRQINRYAGLLAEMGYEKIDRYLLYLGSDYILKKV